MLKYGWKLNRGKVRNSKTPVGDAPQDFLNFQKIFSIQNFEKLKNLIEFLENFHFFNFDS